MRNVRRNVGKERPLAIGGDELQRRIEKHVRAVAARVYNLAVPSQPRIEIAVVRIRRLRDAPGRMNQRLLKTLVLWSHRKRVAQMPLAKNSGPVAGRFQ